MATLALLIGLAVQKFLHFRSMQFRLDWCSSYYQWINKRFPSQLISTPILGLLLLIVPPLLVAVIVFSLVGHILGGVGYWVLLVVWFWYCLDLADVGQEAEASSAMQSVLPYFHGVFAVIFWFLFGPVWLVLYIIISDIDAMGVRTNDAHQLFVINKKLSSLMDWLPVRLLGISVAMTSNFSRILKLWLSSLGSGLSGTAGLVVQWVEAALEGGDPSVPLQKRLGLLLEYSLVVWLIVVVLLTIVHFF